MTPIVNLPWYDLPGTAKDLDCFYTRLRAPLQNVLAESGIVLPRALERTQVIAQQWRSKRLLLSQCCGGDLFSSEGEQLHAVARPVFPKLDCEPGFYYSHIVANSRLKNSPRIAVNARTSYSGCLGLLDWLKHAGLKPCSIVVSGSHIASLALLQRGEVDLIAVDANTWQLLEQSGRGIVGRTLTAPAPPFVCHLAWAHHAGRLRDILLDALTGFGSVAGMGSVVGACRADYALLETQLKPPSSDSSNDAARLIANLRQHR